MELLPGTLDRLVLQQISSALLQIPSDNNRKAKYHRITAAGRKHLRCKTGQWSKLAGAVAAVLNAKPEET